MRRTVAVHVRIRAHASPHFFHEHIYMYRDVDFAEQTYTQNGRMKPLKADIVARVSASIQSKTATEADKYSDWERLLDNSVESILKSKCVNAKQSMKVPADRAIMYGVPDMLLC